MDFNFTEEEQDFRRSVRDWVNSKYPKAKVNELERLEDHDGTNFPHQYFQDLAEAGFLGVGIDESFGGQGGGATEQAILMDELPRNLAGLTWVWGISSFCAKSIARFGSPAIRDEFVPAMIAGEKKVAIAITEPGGGTDLLGAMITRAKREDGGFRDQRREDLVDDGARVGLPAAAGEDLRRGEVVARQDAVPGADRPGGHRVHADPEARHALRRARARFSSTMRSCPRRT